MTGTKPSNYGLVEIVVQEKVQNKRIILSAKSIDDVSGTPAKPRSIHSLRKMAVADAISDNSWPQNRMFKPVSPYPNQAKRIVITLYKKTQQNWTGGPLQLPPL